VQQDIQINLLNYKIAPSAGRKKEVLEKLLLAGLVVVLIASLSVSYGIKQGQLNRLQKENQALQAALSQADAVKTSLQADEKTLSQIEAKRKLVEKTENERTLFTYLYQDLDRMNLPGVHFTSLEAESHLLKCHGFASQRSGIGDLGAWFEANSRFGKITALNYKYNKESREYEFDLSVEWKGGPQYENI